MQKRDKETMDMKALIPVLSGFLVVSASVAAHAACQIQQAQYGSVVNGQNVNRIYIVKSDGVSLPTMRELYAAMSAMPSIVPSVQWDWKTLGQSAPLPPVMSMMPCTSESSGWCEVPPPYTPPSVRETVGGQIHYPPSSFDSQFRNEFGIEHGIDEPLTLITNDTRVNRASLTALMVALGASCDVGAQPDETESAQPAANPGVRVQQTARPPVSQAVSQNDPNYAPVGPESRPPEQVPRRSSR